jgi:hypothetical protein
MAEEMPEGTALVTVTVHLTPQAYEALTKGADREGLTRTDAINRAMQMYEVVTGLHPWQRVGYERLTQQLVRFH